MSQRLPLPASLWAATAPPGPETPALRGDSRTEVAIVGAGFTGLSAALHLSAAGRAVAVIDSGEAGWGASGRNGGQVIAGLKHDPAEILARFGERQGARFVAFAGGAADFVFDLIDRHRIACQAERKGWLQAAHSPTLLPVLERRAKAWQALGAPVRFLDGAAATRELGARGYAGALLDLRGGVLQPLAYARGLARAALAAGAAIHAGTPALKLEARGNGWVLTTPQGNLSAQRVVLATNGYTGSLWPGLQQSVVPVMSYQGATAPLGDNLRRSILPEGRAASDTRRLLAYFRLDPEGRLVLGGRGKFRDSSDPADYAAVRQRLSQLFPQLGEVAWQYFWGGRVALTADHYPHLHRLAPNLYAAFGYNGRGVAMASRLGALVAEWMLGRADDELPVPVQPLRPIPLHALRRPVLSLLVGWKGMRDARESRWAR